MTPPTRRGNTDLFLKPFRNRRWHCCTVYLVAITQWSWWWDDCIRIFCKW